MAYSLRLQIEYKDINDIDTRIEIHQEGYAGAPVLREYGSGEIACEISCGDSSGERLPVVYGSQVTLYFDTETDFEFQDFFTSNSRKNKILVYKNNSLAAVVYGEADTWEEPLEAAPYEVSFTGYDGLGLLSDEDFLQEDKTEYTGQMTPLAILALVLGKTGLALPINSAVGFRPAGTVGDPLTVVTKNVVTYREMSCLEVLEVLFQGCRIFQRAGQWWVISNEKWHNPSITCYHYTAAGIADGTVLIDTEFTGFWFEGTGNKEFVPALKQLKVVQDFGYKPNLVENSDFSKFENGNFDGWTAVGLTPQQRVYDTDGNKYVYLPGNERLDPWDTANRTKYLISNQIPVKQASDMFNVKLSFALMGASKQSAYMFWGMFLDGDDGNDYALQAYYYTETDLREVRFRWVQNSHKLAVPVKAHIKRNKVFLGPDTFEVEPDRIEAHPLDEIINRFEQANFTIEGGIPTSGTLQMYLFLPHTGGTVLGSCWRNINILLTDENEDEYPTETEFLLVNDRNNNYVPDDIEMANGDLPVIPNRLTIYDGGFLLAATGEATELWSLDGVASNYPYAELVARLIASEMQYAREAYQVRLADAIPGTAMVMADNNKRFIEAGITYNDRMQTIDGRYVELKALNIDAFTVAEKTTYAEKATSSGGSSSGGGGSSTYAPDERVKLIDPETHDLEGQPGYLSTDDFEQEVDEGSGRAVIALRNEADVPLERYYYGTNGEGIRGFHPLPDYGENVYQVFDEAELLAAWTAAIADTGRAATIYIGATITLTANRSFLRSSTDAKVAFWGMGTIQIIDTGTYSYTISRVTHRNISFRTASQVYVNVDQHSADFIDCHWGNEQYYSETFTNMKISIKCVGTIINNTGKIYIENARHTSTDYNVNYGNIQPFIISNSIDWGTSTLRQMYIQIKNMDAVLSFERFSRVLLHAANRVPFKVTGDLTWMFHADQLFAGEGNVLAHSEMLKQGSVDDLFGQYIPEAPIQKLIGVDENGRIRKSDVDFSNTAHTHDDRYYTETETDALLAGKSDTTHNHDADYDPLGSAAAQVAAHEGTYIHGNIHAPGSDAEDAASIAAIHSGVTAGTVADNDSFNFVQAASGLFKKISWTNIKATLKTYFDTLYSAVNHSHDDRYYTETETNNLLAGKSDTTHNHDAAYAPATHNHDSRYYTETETDALLAGKSDSIHNHDADYDPSGTAAAQVAAHEGTYNHENLHAPGSDAEDASSIAAIHAGVTADTVADNDTFNFVQAASGLLKKISWTNIKATLKTYFDTLYAAVTHIHDDRYYTETETNSLLAAKSDTSHNHSGTYEPAFTKNTAFNKNFGSTAGTVTEGNDSRLSDTRDWNAEIVSQAEAESGTATTARKWTAERVKQAIDALGGGGGGGLDLIGLVKHSQWGGWSANGQLSTLQAYGVLTSISDTYWTKEAGYDDYGQYVLNNGGSSDPYKETLTYSSEKHKTIHNPLLAIKFGLNGFQSNVEGQGCLVGLANNIQETFSSYIGLKKTTGSVNLYFVTCKNSVETATDSGIDISTIVYNLVLDITNDSVIFYLYDGDGTLLATTTHTTNIPTDVLLRVISYAYNNTPYSLGIKQYSSFIIVRA